MLWRLYQKLICCIPFAWAQKLHSACPPWWTEPSETTNQKKPFSLKLFLSGIYSQKQETPTRPVSLYIFFESFIHVYSVFGSHIPLSFLCIFSYTHLQCILLSTSTSFSFLNPLNPVSAACMCTTIWAIHWSMAIRQGSHSWGKLTLPLPTASLLFKAKVFADTLKKVPQQLLLRGTKVVSPPLSACHVWCDRKQYAFLT